MRIFNQLILPHKTRSLQIGISENDHHRCLIWQEDQQIKVHWQDKKEPLELLQAIGYRKKICHYSPYSR